MPNGPGPRMTLPTQLVLQVLIEEPCTEFYGLEIGQRAGVASGTVHPILARFEVAGWLTSRWEQLDPREQGRPRRRYYQLTRDGLELARNALARSQARRTGLLRGESWSGQRRRAEGHA